MTFRTREEKLAIAVEKLRKYFGIRGAPDNAAAITAYAMSTTTPRTSTASGSPAPVASGITPSIDLSSSENQELSEIMRMLIDVQQGAYSINKIITEITARFGNNPNDNLTRLIQIITDIDIRNSGLRFPEFMVNSGLDKLAIAHPIEGRNSGENQKLLVSNDSLINGNTASPTRNSPNVSLILLNSPMTSLVTRSGNACSLFLNSIPTIEISRAVPYLEVTILQPIPAISEDTPRLLAPSIYKFLLGGVQANPGSPTSILQRSKISNETYRTGTAGSEETQRYTELGMEAFTSPQIMVNGDDVANESNRIQPVLDKFRPFLSLTSFSTSEVLSYAANGYRTAQLSMTLHDRSRLAEIAPLIKSEFRGNTQIIIEFGWSHPDGNDLLSESSSGLTNYYGWLINGMRRREKYQIVNNSFSFTENGEVNINLNLATVGTVEMNSVNITDGVDTDSSIVASLQEIENVRQTIVRLSDRFAENQEAAERAGGRTRELNGVQILESASDTFNNLILSEDQRRELRQFIQATRAGTTAGSQPEIANLRNQLIRLYGEDGTGSATRNLRVNVINAIASKISEIANFARNYPIGTPPPTPAPTTRRGRPRAAPTPPGADPFLVANHPSNVGEFRGTGRLVSAGSTRASTTGTTSTNAESIGGARDGIERSDVRAAAANTGNVSLATLISNFIVHPLAKTGLYEEIQVIYYPFNDSAAYASQLNIAQFSVDLAFFQERYIRYRLENISRTGTMTLGQFWTFFQENIVEDLAARSYGLYDSSSRATALLINPDNEAREDGALASDAVPADDGAVFTSRLNSILRDVTPDGNWRQPQLAYLLETLSEYAEETTSTTSETQQRKSILRMHIYDRQSTAYGTLGELLLADRRRLLNIPVVPPNAVDPLTNEGVPAVREQYASRIRQQMINGNLIRQISGTGEGNLSSNPPRYEVIGGPRAIKNFMCANMPYILPGIQSSLVIKADLQSQQDAAMASLNMINAPRSPSIIEPNGVEPGNLPIQIVPVELQLETYGCPLISFAGQYFVDFNTGTSADDIYAINGIDHTLNQGDFKTSIKMRPITGYGQYRNFVRQLNEFAVEINNINDRNSRELAAAEAAATEAASGRGTGGISGEGVRPGAGGALGGGAPGDGSVGGFA